MNALSSLLKNSDMCCDKKKKNDLVQKIRYVFVYVKKKKIVFGKEKSDLCLLNKTKSFGLLKKKKLVFNLRKVQDHFTY